VKCDLDRAVTARDVEDHDVDVHELEDRLFAIERRELSPAKRFVPFMLSAKERYRARSRA